MVQVAQVVQVVEVVEVVHGVQRMHGVLIVFGVPGGFEVPRMKRALLQSAWQSSKLVVVALVAMSAQLACYMLMVASPVWKTIVSCSERTRGLHLQVFPTAK